MGSQAPDGPADHFRIDYVINPYMSTQTSLIPPAHRAVGVPAAGDHRGRR
jgi:hypothetical protein